MRIAFYSPMKPPDSPIPSGDRQMARQLIRCLKSLGHDVRLMSRMKSREPTGNKGRQIIISNRADRIAHSLLSKVVKSDGWRPEAWFTYHLFYKAPDWIGPTVSRALSIPYIIAEASHAPKRREGAWAYNHNQVEKALHQADLVIGLNTSDENCVKPILGSHCHYAKLKPFVDMDSNHLDPEIRNKYRYHINLTHRIPEHNVWLLAVGMMRKGAKFESYKLLSESLKKLPRNQKWSLIIIGDGPCRSQIEALFPSNTFFLGALSKSDLAKYYSAADIFVWPAIQEAYGMALLEAQWAGLPAIAGNSGGVSDILRDNATGFLTQPGDPTDFAVKVQILLEDATKREQMSITAKNTTLREHGFQTAAEKMNAFLNCSLKRFRPIR